MLEGYSPGGSVVTWRRYRATATALLEDEDRPAAEQLLRLAVGSLGVLVLPNQSDLVEAKTALEKLGAP
jgi:hypothetical protein